jgi:hypothetical protein
MIHLTAGLQFTGVESVVGTFWKVMDSTVQRLVEAFYKKICGDGNMNFKRAVQAPSGPLFGSRQRHALGLAYSIHAYWCMINFVRTPSLLIDASI